MTTPTSQTVGIEWIDGGVTAPLGFVAGGTYTGIKTYGPEPRLDAGILAGEGPCTVAALFTQNEVVGEPVTWNRRVLSERRAVRGLVCNSGNANTVTGEQGARDCAHMAEIAADRLGCSPDEVLVGSTGVIGRLLPMDRLEQGLREVELTTDGGYPFARAIMTTDTHEKQCAVRVEAAGRAYHVGGCAKGSGMIHPDMATMFGFMTTDAPAEPDWLDAILRRACDRTFNMIDVDMDTSTSDTALVLASGAAGGDVIDAKHPAAPAVAAAIEAVARRLARMVARDGEGATALIEAVVEGAVSEREARLAARTVTSSPLVKTMITGRDPNWGRVMMAVGRSGARVDQRNASVWIGEHCVLDRGTPTEVDLTLVSDAMGSEEVRIRAHLGSGEATATAWGCNMTASYVHINADYTT